MLGKSFIIAEAGVNHNGILEMAIQLIEKAVESGADAIKFQTYKTELLVTVDAQKAEYQKQTTAPTETQFDMLKRLELSEDDHLILLEYCRKLGIEFMSTPFDMDSLMFLTEKCGLKRIKISSGDLTNGPMLLACARAGLPLILSTGMGTLAEIEEALITLAFGYLHPNGNPTPQTMLEAYISNKGQELLQERITLLHCTTEYPAPLSDVHLRSMDSMAAAFGLPVGYSDHTEGIAIPLAAVARGAVVIEKHFTLDRNLHGPDHVSSLEPHQLAEMIKGIREVEIALGRAYKLPVSSELRNRNIARKSLVAKRDIVMGEIYSESNITVKRPGDGVSAARYWEALGKQADQSYRHEEKIDI